MAKLRATMKPNGQTRIDLSLPVGEQCSERDDLFNALLECFGVSSEDEKDLDPRLPPQEHKHHTSVKQKA